MRYNRVLHTSSDILVPVEEARAVVSVPNAPFLDATAILEEERTAFKISKEHYGCIADFLLVSMRLADSVAIERHAEELAWDHPFRQHALHKLVDLALRMVLTLLLLLHPAKGVILPLLRCVVRSGV